VAVPVDAVTEFRAEATRFCALIEEAKSHGGQLLDRLVRVLPSVYATAVRLPSISPTSDKLVHRELAHEQREAIFEQLSQALGDSDLYWSVEALDDEDTEAFRRSLANDLKEIYSNLKEGLIAWEAGESEDDVVWEWRFSFWSHWGNHLVDALRAVHTHLAEVGGESLTTQS